MNVSAFVPYMPITTGHYSKPMTKIHQTESGTDTVREFGDFVQSFQVDALGVRGRLVRLGDSVEEITGGGRYPKDVAELLAETMALGTALASGLKYDGVFTLQAQGNGPVKILLADLTSGGDIRGYAQFNADVLAETKDTGGGLVPRLLGGGYLAFTVDQGLETDRYQGITELTGATLADCAQTYFRVSEQLETAIVLTARRADDGAMRAAAFVVQKMPDAGPEGFDDPLEPWREATVLTSTVTAKELLDADLVPADLLYRMFHERGVRVFESMPLRHACRCSEDRVATTLASFPRTEIEAMREDGVITVTCEFCGNDYVFDNDALERLFA